jgi:hypothetical protein
MKLFSIIALIALSMAGVYGFAQDMSPMGRTMAGLVLLLGGCLIGIRIGSDSGVRLTTDILRLNRMLAEQNELLIQQNQWWLKQRQVARRPTETRIVRTSPTQQTDPPARAS